MPETVGRCPLCGHEKSTLFDRREFRGVPVANRLCARCGLVYQSPRMDPDELDAFYERTYRQLYQGEEGPDQRDLSVQWGRAESLLHFVRGRIGSPTRLLDVGSSSGALLIRFRDHFGTQPVGVEPGDAYRRHAQDQGLTVYADLANLEEEEGPFDLITMAHVLEHLPEPVAYLETLRRDHLAAGGHLLVEVPNLFAHNSFEVAHLFSFSAHTLRQSLKKAGFRTLALRQHGEPRSVVLPLYLTALAAPMGIGIGESASIRPERGVALKRRAGMLRRRILQRLFPDLAWLPRG